MPYNGGRVDSALRTFSPDEGRDAYAKWHLRSSASSDGRCQIWSSFCPPLVPASFRLLQSKFSFPISVFSDHGFGKPEEGAQARKPRPYKPIDQVPLGTDTHSGWGVPVKVPKGALRELETEYASLIQEKYNLQLKLRNVLNAAAKVGEKNDQRKEQYKTMTDRQLKPFVDPQIWKDLEEPVHEALQGLYGLCKGDGLKTRRCPHPKGRSEPRIDRLREPLSAYRLHNLAAKYVRAFDPNRGHVHLHDRLPMDVEDR
jgi:hypothetical protein